MRIRLFVFNNEYPGLPKRKFVDRSSRAFRALRGDFKGFLDGLYLFARDIIRSAAPAAPGSTRRGRRGQAASRVFWGHWS